MYEGAGEGVCGGKTGKKLRKKTPERMVGAEDQCHESGGGGRIQEHFFGVARGVNGGINRGCSRTGGGDGVCKQIPIFKKASVSEEFRSLGVRCSPSCRDGETSRRAMGAPPKN